jgi:MYXO-CTERM domain-containing protein
VVKFRAKVSITKGEVANTAILKATGESGGAEKTFESDGDPTTLGKQPTVVVVNECKSDNDCSGLKPVCDPETHTCVGCKTDADCLDPANPACQPSGACGQCSATNDVLCTGGTPVCETTAGVCVLCTQGSTGDATMCEKDPDGPVCMSGPGGSVFCGCTTDADCGSSTSGRVCDTSVEVCIDGCRGKGGNGCPTELVCTSPDTTIGECVEKEPDNGTGGTGGAGGVGGMGGEFNAEVNDTGDDGGCACSTTTHRGWGGAMAGLFALGAIAFLRRRRN